MPTPTQTPALAPKPQPNQTKEPDTKDVEVLVDEKLTPAELAKLDLEDAQKRLAEEQEKLRQSNLKIVEIMAEIDELIILNQELNPPPSAAATIAQWQRTKSFNTGK